MFSKWFLYVQQIIFIASKWLLYVQQIYSANDLRTIIVWSLFCLIWLYVGLHFLRFLFENWFFIFLCLLWIKILKYAASSCYVILICSFVLTLYKNSPFVNNKLFTKVLLYYVKTWFQKCFEFFKKTHL